MINLQESMGPGRDQTPDPWICSQTSICCQTHYRLRYAAWHVLFIFRPEGKGWIIVNYFSYFSTKTHVVGTQKSRLNETVLLSTHNIRFN